MINGLALLGWNPPQQPNTDSEVLSMDDLLRMFELEKVGKSGVKFSMDKLEFFNQMHIRRRFDVQGCTDAQVTEKIEQWRTLLLENLPGELHPTIRHYEAERLSKIMALMSVRIHFFHDMANH